MMATVVSSAMKSRAAFRVENAVVSRTFLLYFKKLAMLADALFCGGLHFEAGFVSTAMSEYIRSLLLFCRRNKVYSPSKLAGSPQDQPLLRQRRYWSCISSNVLVERSML